MRSYSLNYQRFPSLQFNPHPIKFEIPKKVNENSNYGDLINLEIPKRMEDIAFYTIPQLNSLIRQRKITSLELTQLYLTLLFFQNV